MILAYFILAHLLGDFVFQPSRLVFWKIRSGRGVLVHVLIHFLTTVLILLPFILNGYIWLIGIAAIIAFFHFWIDQAKINYDLKHDEKVTPFVIDQLLHLLTILVAYFFIQDLPLTLPAKQFYSVYSDIRIIIFFSFMIFVSAVIEIFYYQKQREKNKKARLKINSDRLLTRIMVFTVVYALFMLLSFYARGIHVFAQFHQ